MLTSCIIHIDKRFLNLHADLNRPMYPKCDLNLVAAEIWQGLSRPNVLRVVGVGAVLVQLMFTDTDLTVRV